MTKQLLVIGEHDSNVFSQLEYYKRYLPTKYELYLSDIVSFSDFPNYISHDWNTPISLPQKFDIIIANNVLEHIQNLGIFMKNVYRLLKDDGTFIIRTDSATWLPFYIKVPRFIYSRTKYGFLGLGVHVGCYPNSEDDDHYHVFTISHLKNLAINNGFKVIKAEYVLHKWGIYKLPLLNPRALVVLKKE